MGSVGRRGLACVRGRRRRHRRPEPRRRRRVARRAANTRPRVLDGRRGGWIRARVVASVRRQPSYTASPQIHAIEAATVGGTVDGVNAEIVTEEVLGISDGTAGQRFPVRQAPVLAGMGAPVLECSSDEGWEPWAEMQDFAASGPERRGVRAGRGGRRGATRHPRSASRTGRSAATVGVPAKGEQLRIRSYATGGGRGGNVSRGAISVMKSSIPVRRTRREPARQRAAGWTARNWRTRKQRGPIQLRTRARAVTTEDFEQLSREAAPEVARVRCLAAGEGLEAGSVRILVVPSAADDRGRIRFEQLIPGEETLQDDCVPARKLATGGHARARRTPAVSGSDDRRSAALAPSSQRQPRRGGSARRACSISSTRSAAAPTVTGGRSAGRCRPARSFRSCRQFPMWSSCRTCASSAQTRPPGARGQATQRLDVAPNSLVFSYEHQVRVESA